MRNKYVILAAIVAISCVGLGATNLPPCAPDLDKQPAPEPIMRIDGDVIQAINAASQRLQSRTDMTARQKDLTHYTVGISQDDRAIYVDFLPNLSLTDKVLATGGNENGVWMVIAVQHKTGKVLAVYGEG